MVATYLPIRRTHMKSYQMPGTGTHTKMDKKCPRLTASWRGTRQKSSQNKPINVKVEVSTRSGVVAIMECFLEERVCEHLETSLFTLNTRYTEKTQPHSLKVVTFTCISQVKNLF